MSIGDFLPRFFTIEIRQDVVIARVVDERITEEDNIHVFGDELFSLVDHYNCRRIVLNLVVLEYATSSVLGKLIMLHRKLNRVDGRLALCCINERLQGILEHSRLNTYFTIRDDIDAAVEAVSEDS